MPPLTEKKLEKKPIKFSNLLLGAGLNLFEVTVSSSSLAEVRCICPGRCANCWVRPWADRALSPARRVHDGLPEQTKC